VRLGDCRRAADKRDELATIWLIELNPISTNQGRTHHIESARRSQPVSERLCNLSVVDMTLGGPFRVKSRSLRSQSDLSFGSHSRHCSTRSAKREGSPTTEPSNSEAARHAGGNHPLILPDRQITSCFPKWPVQPLLQKYFCFRLTQIRCISLDVSSLRGAIARRHERGAGCGGRKSVRRAMAIAGRDEPRERSASVQDDRRFSGR